MKSDSILSRILLSHALEMLTSEVKCLMKTYSYYFEHNLYKLSFLIDVSPVNRITNFLFISIDFLWFEKRWAVTLMHPVWIGSFTDFWFTPVIGMWSESGFEVFVTLIESLEQ